MSIRLPNLFRDLTNKDTDKLLGNPLRQPLRSTFRLLVSLTQLGSFPRLDSGGL